MSLPSDAPSDVSPVSAHHGPYTVAGGGSEDTHALRKLAGRLSHHLFGLVNSIEGYTDLLAHTLGTEEQRELSLRILEGTARIERVVHDLRRFSEPVDPVVRVVTARKLVDGLRDALGPKRWLHVDVEWALAECPHELLADPVLLRQGLLVLVQNAFEATPGRSIRLVVSSDAELGTRFAVWNAGSIAVPEPRRQIFEPFFSTKGPHLGIGLSLARRIAEAHDGALELVETDAETGTWFALRLPHPHDHASDRLLLRHP